MTWSEESWPFVEPVYKEILKLPFLKGLMDGTLPKEKFFYFLQQDSIYLTHYGKVMCAIASKFKNTEYRKVFLSFAGDSVVMEESLHEFYIKDIEKKSGFEASPTCRLYTGIVSQALISEPLEVIVASVLPCFVIYKKVGDYMLAHQVKKNNPYSQWINTYGGEKFDEFTQLNVKITDELASYASPKVRKAMKDIYILLTKLEWMFWDSAWRMEKWPV